jgi:8-oxo-dGTP pyrophosphatase MutT (NUDIX family)
VIRYRRYRVLPGREAAFTDFFLQHVLPVQLEHGAELVGRYADAAGEAVVTLWRYDDEASLAAIADAVARDPRTVAALDPLAESVEELLLHSTVPRPAGVSGHVAWLRERVGSGMLVLPSVTAVIRDDDGRILLQLHAETDEWGLPGGAVEPEEEPTDALVREVREETGLDVAVGALVGVYGGPDATVHYRNGDVTSYVRIAYAAHPLGGTLQPDGHESLDARWTTPADRAALAIPPIVRRVLSDAGG